MLCTDTRFGIECAWLVVCSCLSLSNLFIQTRRIFIIKSLIFFFAEKMDLPVSANYGGELLKNLSSLSIFSSFSFHSGNYRYSSN